MKKSNALKDNFSEIKDELAFLAIENNQKELDILVNKIKSEYTENSFLNFVSGALSRMLALYSDNECKSNCLSSLEKLIPTERKTQIMDIVFEYSKSNNAPEENILKLRYLIKTPGTRFKILFPDNINKKPKPDPELHNTPPIKLSTPNSQERQF